jgi:hypothetical protein
MSMSNLSFMRRALVTAGALAILVACGGGIDGSGGTPPPDQPLTSSGVMTKGSVILNGIRFDDSSAVITDDRGRSAAQLANGMVVRLRGHGSGGPNGVADRVDVENEVRASITSINAAANPQSFVAGGLTVLVDTDTVFANVANFTALTVGMRVEVHGLRDANGNLHASRVEALGAGQGLDELRGNISALNTTASTFVLNGSITVNFGTATFSPAGASVASLANGVLVEVRGAFAAGNTFIAAQVDIEDLEDDPLRGRVNERQEVEGFITGFTAHPGSFFVNGRPVTSTNATRFEGGTAADLANNAKVEVEGTIDAQGVLVASKIEFRNTRVQLFGRVTAVNVGNRTIVTLGETVQANDLTRIDTRGAGGNSTSLADLTVNIDCVEVRGRFEGSTIVADEIKEPSGCGDELVQAPVTAKNDTTFTLTFFGSLTASLAGTAQFADVNGNALTRAQFFAAVVPAGPNNVGTLVKVKGNTLAAVEEAELED